MKIQHLTFKGSDVIRDSTGILPETIQHFMAFQVKSGAHTLKVDKTNFHIKLTVTDEGAMFDVMKNNHIAYSNACCFAVHQQEGIIELCQRLAATLDNKQILKLPTTHLFIYTFPINPFALTPEENIIAGEIALYIYYSLYLAYNAQI